MIAVLAVGGYLVSRNSSKLLAMFNSVPPLDPLAASIPVTSTGNLKVGNFNFVSQRGGPVRSSTFKPGEQAQISYDIEGFAKDSGGLADVQIQTTVLDATGAPVSQPQLTRFHEALTNGNRINSWFGVTLTDSFPGGDYVIDVQLHDNVASSDLEFKPQLHLDVPARQAVFEPVPASFQAVSTGRLLAGNFKFVDPVTGAEATNVWSPGQQVQISYGVMGLSVAGDGTCNLELETTVLDASGAAITQPYNETFNQPCTPSQIITRRFGVDLGASMGGGNYWIDIKVHDVVANTDLEFKPMFVVDAIIQSPPPEETAPQTPEGEPPQQTPAPQQDAPPQSVYFSRSFSTGDDTCGSV